MFVIKRDGRSEAVKFDKITGRIKKLCYGLHPSVDAVKISMKVIEGIYDGVTTTILDNLAAETAASLTISHPDYALLASRIAVSNLHKNTEKSFSATMGMMYKYTDPNTNKKAPLLADDVYKIIQENAEQLDSTIIYDRDFGYDYFGFKTLERSYLLKMHGEVVERPQHMLMRVAIGIHKEDIDSAIETYDLMSERWFTHATPTLFNAGTPKPQMSSCFLLTTKDDSISGIYDTLTQCAKISQSAGGIGLAIHNIRATGSYIRGTNGACNGIVPMLRVFNDTARYVDQGGGKRKGSFAIYLEPWHADIFDFLDLKKNHGKEEQRARDLFFALWTPDLFMKRVEEGGNWSLMCPDECPGLSDCWGEEFEKLYTKYEKEGKLIPVFSMGYGAADGSIVRDPAYPEMPTITEGYTKLNGKAPSGPAAAAYNAYLHMGVTASKSFILPKGTPDEIVDVWVEAVKKVVADKGFRKVAAKVVGAYQQSYGKDAANVLRMATDVSPETKAWLKAWIKRRFDHDI